jgi:hypothetical protein
VCDLETSQKRPRPTQGCRVDDDDDDDDDVDEILHHLKLNSITKYKLIPPSPLPVALRPDYGSWPPLMGLRDHAG